MISAEVIVDDREDRPFMLVEVRASVDSAEMLSEFIEQLERSDSSITFGMVVDLDNIHLFKRDSPGGNFVKGGKSTAKRLHEPT